MTPWKLPLVVAAIAVPIAFAFYFGGPGVGVAVGRPGRGRDRRRRGPPAAARARSAAARGRRRPTRAGRRRRPARGSGRGRADRRRSCERAIAAEVLVLSPARIGFLDRWASDVEGARREAQRRLVISVAALATAGIDAEARVGDEDLVQAVEDQLGQLPGDRGDPGQRRRRGGPGRGRGRRGAAGAAAGRVPAAGRQRSSSSLKRSAARVGSTKPSSRWSRPAAARSRTARSTASRSAKPPRPAADLPDQLRRASAGSGAGRAAGCSTADSTSRLRPRSSSCRRSRSSPLLAAKSRRRRNSPRSRLDRFPLARGPAAPTAPRSCCGRSAASSRAPAWCCTSVDRVALGQDPDVVADVAERLPQVRGRARAG